MSLELASGMNEYFSEGCVREEKYYINGCKDVALGECVAVGVMMAQ